jgi:hypothetical protein
MPTLLIKYNKNMMEKFSFFTITFQVLPHILELLVEMGCGQRPIEYQTSIFYALKAYLNLAYSKHNLQIGLFRFNGYITNFQSMLSMVSSKFVMFKPLILLSACTFSDYTLVFVACSLPPHNNFCNITLHFLIAFLDHPQTFVKKHKDDANIELMMRILHTRGRWINNQYLNFSLIVQLGTHLHL